MCATSVTSCLLNNSYDVVFFCGWAIDIHLCRLDGRDKDINHYNMSQLKWKMTSKLKKPFVVKLTLGEFNRTDINKQSYDRAIISLIPVVLIA